MKNYRKILAVLLALCMLPTMFLTTISANDDITFTSLASEDGANGVKVDGTTYTLTKNITVSATNDALDGVTIDGAGYTITTTVPLFKTLSGTVMNLTIAGDIVDSTTSGGADGVAALTRIVSADITLQSVTNNANVTSTVASPNQLSVGGLIGLAKGSNANLQVKLENCVNNGTISAVSATSGGGSGRVYVGGFIGMTASAKQSTGGKAYLKQCVNNGNVSSNCVSGGLVGRTTVQQGDTIEIEKCVNAGNITTANDGKMSAGWEYCCAGGFVGVNANKRIKIKESFNLGDVSASAAGTNTSTSKASAAGLCNFYDVSGNILLGVEDCWIVENYSIGKVKATAPAGEITHAGLLISDHYKTKDKGWTEAKLAFIETNYVLKVDSTMNGQDVFCTDRTDETEISAVSKLTERVKSVDFKMTQEASIRLYSMEETGIRFNSGVNKNAISAMIATIEKTYGDNYEIGTMLWKTADADDLSEYTHEALNAAGVAFTEAKRTSPFNDNELDPNDNTKYIIRGSLVDIAAENSDVLISARAYVKIGDHYFYADGVSTTCVKDIANIAYNDETANYSEEVKSWLVNYGATKKEDVE